MDRELQEILKTFIRLASGLLAVAYLAGFAWMLVQLYQMII